MLAELARISYYRGRYADGLALAREAAKGPPGLGTGRAALAASIDLIALNRGFEALSAVQAADVEIRTAAAGDDDKLGVLVQQVHVEANMGRHSSSVSTGRAAVHLAERSNMSREAIARARYALGFALSYAGADDAIAHLLAAEALARAGNAMSLHRWILFCIAMHLRDLGWRQAARDFLARSNVAVRHERAWFAFRLGDLHEARLWLRARVASDERPYVRLLIAAFAGNTVRARMSAINAQREFQAGGLDHWSWAARWRVLLTPISKAEWNARLSSLIDELAERNVRRWGFYDPTAVLPVLRLAPQTMGRAAYIKDLKDLLERDGSEPLGTQSSVLVRALGILHPEALEVLREETGLSPAETRTLVAAVERWLQAGAITRAELASDLGVGEAAVRTHLSAVRSKLRVSPSRRGVEPLVAWLANRSLLTPETSQRAVRILTGAFRPRQRSQS